jgi:hypothetical protein
MSTDIDLRRRLRDVEHRVKRLEIYFWIGTLMNIIIYIYYGMIR